MQDVGGVDISTYEPVHENAYYGDVSISETGSMRPTDPLSEEVISFLVSINVDVSLWNGSSGVFGRPYEASGESCLTSKLTVEQAHQLRTAYLDVKRTLQVAKSQQQFKKDLETKMKLQTQLEISVKEIEQKADKVRKQLCICESKETEQRSSKQALRNWIMKIESEIASTKRAAEVVEKKIMETRVDIAESENGFLRRFAILRSIFEDNVSQELVKSFYKEGEDLVQVTSIAFNRSTESWNKTLRAKRFYVDAKIGLTHLYKVEDTLKAVLENLKEALCPKPLGGGPSLGIPSAVGSDFRLGYVRQLWGRIDSYFKEAYPYLKRTSLGNNLEDLESPEIERARSKRPLGCLGAERRKSDVRPILPSFSKIEMTYLISKKARITSLHKAAAAAYKYISAVFDRQEKWVSLARKELEKRENEEMDANETLIGYWERLLDVQDISRPSGKT